ncbi:hypothetical protein [Halomonas sp. M20]|uniref:hypothetical protein n=1 Tax=Halomonas sp. M20 TaxID=2763264 RepID=UPI001D0A5AC2|nr:hypothetical protein [Halomonas sp. M20]
MKSFLSAALLMTFVAGDALAQANTPAHGCDKVLDITDTTSQTTPFALGEDERLCLDSEQVATWFVDQDGWGSEVTSDKRYWQLTPPGPTRAIFTLHLPSGDQRKLRVVVNPAEANQTDANDESPQN